MSLIKQTCLFDETLPELFINLLFPFFEKKHINNSSHFITVILCDCSAKLSSSVSSDPYHFGGKRSVLSWETIVHHPRYKLRGQIRLKDTTLLLGSDMHSNYCLHCRFVSLIFSVSDFKRTLELQS